MVDLNMTFVAQLIHFAIIIGLVYGFAYKPIAANMEARTERIRTEIANADRDQAEAAKLKEEYEGKLAQARIKAQEIVDNAAARAEADRAAAVDRTRAEVEKMKAEAAARLERDREIAAQQMKGEMVSLSLDIASKLIGAKLDDTLNEKMVDAFIKDLDRAKIGDMPC